MYANQLGYQSKDVVQSIADGGAGRPHSTLESAVGCAHNAAGELSQAVDILNSRLQTVMAPPVPTPQGQTKSVNAVEPPHSPAVNDLFALRGRLEALTILVNDMTSRLEA